MSDKHNTGILDRINGDSAKPHIKSLMHSITFFICPSMLSTSVTLPLEQLRAAEALFHSHQKNQSPLWDVRLASLDGKPIETHSGMTLTPDHKLNDIDQSDITFIPALWRNPRPILSRQSPQVTPWLRHQHQLGNIIAGVGTGCCFLAESGLLDDLPATTHWHYFEQFEKSYPNIRLQKNHFITEANNLFCTGSINALADLTIYFIQQYTNTHIASHVERNFFHEIRQTYLSANFLNRQISSHSDELVAEAQIWLQEHAQSAPTMQELANHLDISLRSLNRRFKQATNQTPLEYLQHIRVNTARDLLQSSNLNIGEIAYRVGYNDTTHFSALFKKHFGLTPKEYRLTVRGKLFTSKTQMLATN